jgi:hypothetical protein
MNTKTLAVSLESISEAKNCNFAIGFVTRRIKLWFPTAKVYYKAPYQFAFKAEVQDSIEDILYGLYALSNELGQDCVAYALDCGFGACTYGLAGARASAWGSFNPDYFAFDMEALKVKGGYSHV